MNRPRALEHNDQGGFGTDARPVYANNHDVRNAHHSSVAGWRNLGISFSRPVATKGRSRWTVLPFSKRRSNPLLRRLGSSAWAGTRFGTLVGPRDSRHTYSTLLRSVGTEFNVMQELLRHSSLRSTLDVYTQAVMPAKHAAQAAVPSLEFSSDANGESLFAGRE